VFPTGSVPRLYNQEQSLAGELRKAVFGEEPAKCVGSAEGPGPSREETRPREDSEVHCSIVKCVTVNCTL
jgi:hypothetical protein